MWYELTESFLTKMNVRHNMIPCTSDEHPLPYQISKNSILENDNVDKLLDAENPGNLTDIKTEIRKTISGYGSHMQWVKRGIPDLD